MVPRRPRGFVSGCDGGERPFSSKGTSRPAMNSFIKSRLALLKRPAKTRSPQFQLNQPAGYQCRCVVPPQLLSLSRVCVIVLL